MTIDSRLADRVVAVTGAGRGIGAEYAKLAAAAGAKVVVNDLGRGLHGEGDDNTSPAEHVAAEIRAAGGAAIADGSDIADFDGALTLIATAVEHFGDLDVVINNAGILRDRMLVSMTEQDWDDVVRVHMRGHFATSHHAAAYWRHRARESGPRDAALIHTTSVAGLHGNVGQFSYSAAKAGIAVLATNGHLELNERYGVRSYAIAPGARTRLTLSTPGATEGLAAPEEGFDFSSPANVAPFVVWLAAAGCTAPSGSVFGVEGDIVRRYRPWTIAATVTNGDKWTFDGLDRDAPALWAEPDESVISMADVLHLTAEHIARSREQVGK